mmetsp:Transcript_16507/g.46072  ORF Transcript_16507/g.46072 Transcript_16507/m.46072 type:complete len:230 (-) Transcript_16507:901-1590(-)
MPPLVRCRARLGALALLPPAEKDCPVSGMKVTSWGLLEPSSSDDPVLAGSLAEQDGLQGGSCVNSLSRKMGPKWYASRRSREESLMSPIAPFCCPFVAPVWRPSPVKPCWLLPPSLPQEVCGGGWKVGGSANWWGGKPQPLSEEGSREPRLKGCDTAGPFQLSRGHRCMFPVASRWLAYPTLSDRFTSVKFFWPLRRGNSGFWLPEGSEENVEEGPLLGPGWPDCCIRW